MVIKRWDTAISATTNLWQTLFAQYLTHTILNERELVELIDAKKLLTMQVAYTYSGYYFPLCSSI